MAWFFGNKIRPEDPSRLDDFRKLTRDLSWQKDDTPASLKTLFGAVDDLAFAEVNYYYRRRNTRALISTVTRFLAWMLGTIGLLLPLLDAASSAKFEGWAQFGYVFLAASASSLAANSLFGGSDGHIRFVSTQLELEKLITKARISWSEFIALCEIEKQQPENGFSLIEQYATDLHTATLSETGKWGESLLAELEKYRKKMESSQTS